MTATLQPFGFRPTYSPNGGGFATGFVGGIKSGYVTNILRGQPVALDTDGTIIIAVAGDHDIIGVFDGISWTDSQGVLHSSNQWVGGTTYSGGQASPTYAWVFTDPNQIYSIQCDGTLATASVGGQLDFSNATAGSTTTGLSACTAAAAGLTTSGQQQLRIVSLDPAIGNAWTDAYPIIQVQIAQHQYVANKVAV